MTKKVLITGANGMIGSYLKREFGLNALCFGRDELDVSNSEKLEQLICSNEIDWVINCAGGAHGTAESLFRLNALSVLGMAKVCSRVGVGLAYLSTARVFGTGEGPFAEDDIPCPYDDYGVSKFIGEQFVTRELFNGRYFIFRVGMAFGVQGNKSQNQLLTRLIKMGQAGNDVRAVTDAEATVIYAGCAARKIRECIDADRSNGIYHISSSDWISLYEMVQTAFDKLQLPAKVLPALSHEFATSMIPVPTIQGLKAGKFGNCGSSLMALDKFLSEYSKQIV